MTEGGEVTLTLPGLSTSPRPAWTLYLPLPLLTLRYASFDKLRTGRAGKGGE